MRTSSISRDLLVTLALSLGGVLTRMPYLALIPMFDDEVRQTVYALNIQPGRFLPLVGQDPYTGPLFPYLIAICLRIFGSTPVAPRVVVMVIGALTVGLTYLLARALGLSYPWAGLAGLLMAANPHHILVSSHYAGATFTLPLLHTAFLIALILAVQRRSGPWLVAAGALLGLALQVNLIPLLLLPGVAVWFLGQPTSKVGLRTQWPYLAAIACVLAYAPVILYNLQTGMSSVREVTGARSYVWQPNPPLATYIHNLWRLALQLCRQVGGVLEGQETVAALMGLPLLSGAWAITGLVYAARRRLSLLTLTIASHVLVMPWFSNHYGMVFETRFTNHLMPLLSVAMSGLAAGVWAFVRTRVRAPRTIRAMGWSTGLFLAVLSLWPLIPLFQYYEHETAAGKTNVHYFAFLNEFIERWRGEKIFISESVNGFILTGDLSAPEYFGFNATEYLFATSGIPYSLAPIDQTMRRLVAGRESGRVILVLTNGELPRVELQTGLVAWNSPPVMETCRKLGYGAYTVEDAQQVHKLFFVFESETLLRSIAHPVQASFSGELGILGYELSSAQIVPGGQVVVNVYWQAVDAMPDTYTGFVHLIGPDGQLVAQDDHELGRGFFSTRLWQPGEVVHEEYALTIPDDAPPGQYSLQVGVYSFPSLQRLAVDSANMPVQDDVVTLGAVDLTP